MLVVSPVSGATSQSASSNNAQIGLNEDDNVLKVNAAYTCKVWYKKWYKKWHKRWYKNYNGKWRYKWKYKWKYYWKYYTKVKAASSSTTSSYKSSSKADTSSSTLDSIMESGADYGYSHGASTASAMKKRGAGDCWAMSEYLCNKFKAAGYKTRVIQYATAYSSRHRSVQLYQNGKWKTVPYRAYGYHYFFV